MQKNNKLILALRAEKSDVEIHKHSAYQIVLTENNPFHTTLENKKYQNIYGFVIKPQVAHSCECSNSNLIIINIEAYSFLGKYISEKLGDKNGDIFSDNLDFKRFFNSTKNDFSIQNILNIDQSNTFIELIDVRIEKSIAYINENFKKNKFSTQDIANHIFLSHSRLATLFKKQIGSSIGKYILWTRLKNAIFLILSDNEKSLTNIALESGFYDSSQMIKYMYQMFGISPSKLRQKAI
ncbi:MAG: helix-turn-helix domain-containing protein [Crocinitomicaceae bacterium]|nr:helix-turn-helix domain-containing protein [Crocinitomicaceae bacterium]